MGWCVFLLLLFYSLSLFLRRSVVFVCWTFRMYCVRYAHTDLHCTGTWMKASSRFFISILNKNRSLFSRRFIQSALLSRFLAFSVFAQGSTEMAQSVQPQNSQVTKDHLYIRRDISFLFIYFFHLIFRLVFVSFSIICFICFGRIFMWFLASINADWVLSRASARHEYSENANVKNLRMEIHEKCTESEEQKVIKMQ